MTENLAKASTLCPNHLMGWQKGSVFGHLNILCNQLDGMAGWNFIRPSTLVLTI